MPRQHRLIRQDRRSQTKTKGASPEASGWLAEQIITLIGEGLFTALIETPVLWVFLLPLLLAGVFVWLFSRKKRDSIQNSGLVP